MATWTPLANWLANNSFVMSIAITALGSLLTLIGIVLSVRSARSRKPRFAIKSINLIRDFASQFQGLQVSFAGQPISNLTVSRIAFWNQGRETIRSEDLATTDPLLILSKNNCRILDVSLLQASNPANRFNVRLLEGICPLEFEYLDKRDGGVIQVLHTGKTSSDLEVRGTIKGAGLPRKRAVPLHNEGRLSDRLAAVAFYFVLGAMLVLVTLFDPNREVVQANLPADLFRGFVVLVGLFLLTAGFDALRRRIPASLNAFYH